MRRCNSDAAKKICFINVSCAFETEKKSTELIKKVNRVS